MQKILRALALAFAIVALPACATLKLDNPVAAAETVDQQAYALISTYAVTLEQAAELVRDPATPAGARRALARAEAVATPAVETLKIAVVAYLKADADMRAAPSSARAAEKLADQLRITAERLREAIIAAKPPVAALRSALKSQR